MVTEAEFWSCVRDGRLPDRGQHKDDLPARSLPAGVVYQLIHVAGVPESEVAGMTLPDAMTVMTDHWSRPRQPVPHEREEPG